MANQGSQESQRYRISTITVTGSVNTQLSLDFLFDCFNDFIAERGVGKDDDTQTGLVYAEFGKKRSVTHYQHFSKKFISQRKKDNVSKRFDNQLTIMYKYSENSTMNLKIFKNGNVQITGVKSIEAGKEMISILIDLIREAVLTSNVPIDIELEALCNIDYKVALINSDFKVDFEIKRDRLYSIMINQYDIKCSFEPCIYPGVKIQYYWNKQQTHKNGICTCEQHCFVGKGTGDGESNCKKITIAVFQSGCIIITGAQTTQQIDDAYDFITHALYDNMENIKKPVVPLLTPPASRDNKNIVMIKKNSIIYPGIIPGTGMISMH